MMHFLIFKPNYTFTEPPHKEVKKIYHSEQQRNNFASSRKAKIKAYTRYNTQDIPEESKPRSLNIAEPRPFYTRYPRAVYMDGAGRMTFFAYSN